MMTGDISQGRTAGDQSDKSAPTARIESFPLEGGCSAMSSIRWHVALVVTLVAGAAPAQEAKPKKAEPAKKAKVIYVPAGAKVIDKAAQEVGTSGDFVIRNGGSLEVTGGGGTYYVESGGSLSVVGGQYTVVVQKGGSLTQAVGGSRAIYYEKGATIAEGVGGTQELFEYDTLTFEPFKPFTLKGTVSDDKGKRAKGVAVHAYGLGKEYLGSATTDADGGFTIRPRKSVEGLAADLGPAWADQADFRDDKLLESRRRYRAVKGWEAAVVEGDWGKDATVAVKRTRPAAWQVRPVMQIAGAGRLAGRTGMPAALAFAPDGKHLVRVTDRGTVAVYEVATGKEVLAKTVPDRHVKGGPSSYGSHRLAFSPDGRLLATAWNDGAILVWKLPTGEEARRLTAFEKGATCVAFAPDGKTLAAGSADGRVRVWDAATGRVLTTFKAHKDSVHSLTFIRGGKALVSGGTAGEGDANVYFGGSDRARVWDPATGRELLALPGLGDHVRLTPDERLLAVGGYKMIVTKFPDGFTSDSRPQIWVGDAATGKERFLLTNAGVQPVFAPDGRTLTSVSADLTVRVWETATGKEVLAVPLPLGARTGRTAAVQAFSADGRLLSAALYDGALRVWDVNWPGLYLPQPLAEPDKTWAALSADAPTAYRAMAGLLRSPDKAVPLLKDRLRPAADQSDLVRKRLADQDSPRFAVREAAAKELEKVGAGAVPLLRQALAKKPTAEVRKQIETLLDALEGLSPPAEELRALRAVQVLEGVGTAEARKALQALAEGWPAARQTQEARAALKRLASRPAS
jgi:WD40 repeat protein